MSRVVASYILFILASFGLIIEGIYETVFSLFWFGTIAYFICGLTLLTLLMEKRIARPMRVLAWLLAIGSYVVMTATGAPMAWTWLREAALGGYLWQSGDLATVWVTIGLVLMVLMVPVFLIFTVQRVNRLFLRREQRQAA